MDEMEMMRRRIEELENQTELLVKRVTELEKTVKKLRNARAAQDQTESHSSGLVTDIYKSVMDNSLLDINKIPGWKP
ncbi:MAG: hypothetical protein II705_04460 [Clostridia bacterium]|nr:hypothetical protein [Clostridia bacterium]